MENSDDPLPKSHIFPPETRPGNAFNIPQCNIIPLIDMQDDEINTIKHIIQASKEYGFFQVINHGVSEELMGDAKCVIKEFFEVPVDDKAGIYSKDPSKSKSLLPSVDGVNLWRRRHAHPCEPLDECSQFWPEKPTRYRETMGKCYVEVRKLVSKILELICKGLGLESGYFKNERSSQVLMAANCYPPCPDPRLTLGLPKHCDPSLITLLLLGDVNGLQMFKDGEWIGIHPLPNAFFFNIGHLLQIISNGKLKSPEHRVVTNTSKARFSIVFFFSPDDNCKIEPAEELLAASNTSALYRPFHYKEFLDYYGATQAKTEVALDPFLAK